MNKINLVLLITAIIYSPVNSHAAQSSKADIGDLLAKKSKAVSESIVSNVDQQQKNNSRRLSLRMKIDELRARMGGSSNIKERDMMQEQIKTYEKEINSIR